MTANPASRPVTFRERAYYFWGLTWLGLLVAGLGLGLWALVPRPYFYDLGPVSDFPLNTTEPVRLVLDTEKHGILWLYIVQRADNWLVLDGRTRCRVRWVPTNQHFQEPCTGLKWALTGDLLTYYNARPPHQYQSGLRDLDQFVPFLWEGHLYISAHQIIRGPQRLTPPPTLDCTSLADWPGSTVTNCRLKPTTP